MLAAVQLFLGISDYRQAVSLAMEEIYVPVILEAVVNVASLLFVCLWMVIASCMKGRAFWGFQMALCGILPRCSVGRMAVLVQLLFLLLIFGGGMGIFLEVIRCAGKGQMAQEQLLEEENRQRSRSQVFQASGRIRCLAGQYAGMEIPIRDGETLCIGRDPNLAHLVITEGGDCSPPSGTDLLAAGGLLSAGSPEREPGLPGWRAAAGAVPPGAGKHHQLRWTAAPKLLPGVRGGSCIQTFKHAI